jgi:hypothetical protein
MQPKKKKLVCIIKICWRKRSNGARHNLAFVEAKPIYRHTDHKIRDWAHSQRFDGMAQPTQEHLM